MPSCRPVHTVILIITKATRPLSQQPLGVLTTLEKAYSYEPIPEELSPEEAKHILGAQGNVWTEYMPKSEQVEYMAFPRACALAEAVWSPKSKRNWTDFVRRIQPHMNRLDASGLKFSKSFYDVTASFSNNKVTLESQRPGTRNPLHFRRQTTFAQRA
jgi:hexosaminidase